MTDNKITTLNNLKDKLKNCCNISDYLSLVKSMALEKEEIKDICFFSDKKYTRNCIVRTDDYELIALCWNPGQKTPIHCHNNQECWMYIISGEISEEVFKFDLEQSPALLKESIFDRGKFAFINDSMGLHKISNKSNKQAISLHLYVKPIDSCSYFNQEKGTFEIQKMYYENKIK